jgi:hypothetical protein
MSIRFEKANNCFILQNGMDSKKLTTRRKGDLSAKDTESEV